MIVSRDGRAFLWTFVFPRARAPRFFLCVSRSRFPVQHFFAVPCAPALLFRVPSVCVGVGEQLITRALCVYGLAGRVNSPPRQYPLSSRVRGVRVYWREAGLRSTHERRSAGTRNKERTPISDCKHAKEGHTRPFKALYQIIFN